jgi:death-on-curing protein
MKEPIWVSRLVLDAVHHDQLGEHGGLQGVRDENALESALARARNRWAYDSVADLFVLAAAYGYGLATNHPYHDGNERVAFLAMAVFLGLNGWEIEASEAEVVSTMVAVAAGRCSETRLAEWIEEHAVPLPP